MKNREELLALGLNETQINAILGSEETTPKAPAPAPANSIPTVPVGTIPQIPSNVVGDDEDFGDLAANPPAPAPAAQLPPQAVGTVIYDAMGFDGFAQFAPAGVSTEPPATTAAATASRDPVAFFARLDEIARVSTWIVRDPVKAHNTPGLMDQFGAPISGWNRMIAVFGDASEATARTNNVAVGPTISFNMMAPFGATIKNEYRLPGLSELGANARLDRGYLRVKKSTFQQLAARGMRQWDMLLCSVNPLLMNRYASDPTKSPKLYAGPDGVVIWAIVHGPKAQFTTDASGNFVPDGNGGFQYSLLVQSDAERGAPLASVPVKDEVICQAPIPIAGTIPQRTAPGMIPVAPR